MHFFSEKIDIKYLDDNSIVLDIETTGVSRINSNVIVIGIVDHLGNFLQFSIDNISEEKKLLEKVKPYLENKHIISFNGKNFDIPFLKSRYAFFGLNSFTENSQFDIYRYFIKNKLLTDINNFSLQEIEKYGEIERFENFEYFEDQHIYNNLHNIELSKILIHNKYDVINTEKLLGIVEVIEKNKIIYLYDYTLKIDELYIDKNYLKINLSAPKLEIDQYYTSVNHELIWNSDKIDLKIKIENGYIDDQTLGYVYISDIEVPTENKKYQLPKNFLVIFDNRYFLDNIKNIISQILKKYIN